MKTPSRSGINRFPAPSGRHRLVWTILLVIVIVVPLITFRLRRSLPALVKTRSAELVFLVPLDNGYELMRTRENLAQIMRLTETNGSVDGFAVSPDGERILYFASNDAGGSDLWQVDRDGKKPERVVSCGEDSCAEVVWSPDGERAAYVHKKADGTARLAAWILKGNETIDLRVVIPGDGRAFNWSPDSTRLAYYDPQDRLLKTVDAATGDIQPIQPAQIIGAPDWSPDGKRVAYSSEVDVNGFLSSVLIVYDLQTDSATQMQTGPAGADISPPQWSPDGNWLLVGQRTTPNSPAKQLFLIRADGLDFESIVEDLTATHSAYQWSPDGNRIVFQQYKLGSSKNRPEVWVWERERGEAWMIARDAIQPQWLP